jgi:hypothetical protein
VRSRNGEAKRISFFHRAIKPAGMVFLAMAVSLSLYKLSAQVEGRLLHGLLSSVFAVTLFLSIGFGALFVYPFAYFRGAGIAERILASLFTPLLWAVKEIVRVNEYFTVGESLYYGLNSLILLTFFGTFGLMGICEVLCRLIARRRGARVRRILSPIPVAAIVVSLFALWVLLIWGMGVHWFYIYMEGYKALFL